MTGRGGDKKNPPSSKPSARQSQFFISGEGIDREVITTDICRYLGNDALVKPGNHQDKATGRVQEGFYITAYRPPTSAQLADLRADSLKWQEERRKNSARTPGGYNESATRLAALGGGSIDEPRQPGGYPATGYGQMAPPQQNMPTRNEYTSRVSFPTTNTQMPPPAAPSGPYRNPAGYQSSESNYVYGAPPPAGYSGMDNNRDRMETAPGQPPWNIPQGSAYPPSGVAPIASGYSTGRPGYNYSPVAGNPPVPAGYGRAEPQGNYNDPYGPRDSGVPQQEPQGEYYANDDDMDYEESPAPAPAQAPPRQRERERERDRDHEPRQKHRHR